MTGKAAILGLKNDQTAGLQTPSLKLPKAILSTNRQPSTVNRQIIIII